MDTPNDKRDALIAAAIFAGRELKRMYTELLGAGYSEDNALTLTAVAGLELAVVILGHWPAITKGNADGEI